MPSPAASLPLAAMVLLALALHSSPAAAAGETGGLACPTTFEVEQQAKAPEGWTLGNDRAPVRLASVTFFDGPPAERASLVYDEQATSGGQWVATWRLGKNPRGFWISCAYEGTTATLSRRLPETVAACRVTYEKDVHLGSGLPAIQRIDCR
jgi:hypothetical protein